MDLNSIVLLLEALTELATCACYILCLLRVRSDPIWRMRLNLVLQSRLLFPLDSPGSMSPSAPRRTHTHTHKQVVTDGILIRMLQRDPGLNGVGAVLFDEFHERNLDSDLALALCLDSQQLARPDLRCAHSLDPDLDLDLACTYSLNLPVPRLAVMSATLGGGLDDRVASLMEPPSSSNSVPVVKSEGRSYPVGE